MNNKGDIVRILGIAIFSVLLAASTVIAGFALKKGVFRIDQLDLAKSDALSRRRAMAFLYSDENTFCIQCSRESVQAMETLADSCIMVYVAKSDANKLPVQVKNALRSREAGKYIPAIVIMTFDLKKVGVS
jgi:hypothetical protein